MRNERSAGFIVFRRDADGARLYLILDYGRFWDYPKGHVEKGEDDLSAALRELEEETSLKDVKVIDGFTRQLKYFFRAGKTLVHKTVIFFLAETERVRVKVSHEHSGYAWLAIDEALKRVTYPTSRRVLQEAEAFLAGNHA